VTRAQDFDSVLRHHSAFLRRLLTRCFLESAMAPVKRLIDTILALSLRFAIVVRRNFAAPEALYESGTRPRDFGVLCSAFIRTMHIFRVL
jgi:hypothetical protein